MREIPEANLQILALNTNLYYRTNITSPDPCSQIKWLETKLEDAKSASKKVIIAGHVPPGYFERAYFDPFFTNKAGSVSNDLFASLVTKYSDTVRIHFSIESFEKKWIFFLFFSGFRFDFLPVFTTQKYPHFFLI